MSGLPAVATSEELFARARRLMPGGVSSPARAFRAVGRDPVYVQSGAGPHLRDVEGREYVDYVLGFGPMILGHGHARVVAAVREAAESGMCFGACSPLEVELAEELLLAMPHLERVRFVNSGTEAVMSALRVARAFTGRERIVKFAGHYHGHADMLLVDAGSGVATLGLPDSPGVPAGAAATTMTARFNDLDSVDACFRAAGGQIAAIIVEPVPGNMGVVPPLPGFLEGLRDRARTHGALLVFDEVMCGFRVHPRGATALYDVIPDLTVLGKVIGGGLPIGAYGGRADVMSLVAPEGPVYQAGTFSGNPMSMSAGLATLRELRETEAWHRAESVARILAAGLEEIARDASVGMVVNRVGTMLTPFFTAEPVVDWQSAARSDRARFARFFGDLLDRGVYPPPSQFEAWFTSSEHGAADVERTLDAAREALAS